MVVSALVLGLLGMGPGVAGACACGAVLADQRLTGVKETALVELAGGRQSVTLNIGGATESGAVAFVMPVPARAEFELADGAVFTELDELSAPRVEYREVEIEEGESGGGAPPGDLGVTVTDHVEVGPFEVAQLSGVDSTSVAEWLSRNDFTLSPELADALTPYLAEGWLVVAVRLTPQEAATFADGLPPMRFTYATTEPVYPMRLSATAEYEQPLRLYVLADHRMDAGTPAPPGTLDATYAGWVTPADVTEYPALATRVDTRRFLTRYDASFTPSEIVGDIPLTRAAADTPHRDVVIETRYVQATGIVPAALWFLAVAVVVAAGLVLLRRRQAPRDSATRRIQ